jgi:leucyl/phenylalanyl-tRNA--protein transferase
MFSRMADASKVALSALVHRALERQIELIDCQMPSRHLASLGSRAISRTEFLRLIDSAQRLGQNRAFF